MKFSIIKKIKSKLKEDQFCAVLTDIESGNQIFIDHKKDIAEVENENTKKHFQIMSWDILKGFLSHFWAARGHFWTFS